MPFLSWGGVIRGDLVASSFVSSSTVLARTFIGLDGVTYGNQVQNRNGAAVEPTNASLGKPIIVTEGYHYLTLMGSTSFGTSYWTTESSELNVTVRG